VFLELRWINHNFWTAMNHSLMITFCITSLLLTGCTSLSHHKQPVIPIPQKTRSGTSIENNAKDLSQVKWWEKMHDQVLDRLIKEALINNNQIHSAKANILQAQAKLKEAQFAWLPTLGATGSGFIGRTWDSSFTPQGVVAQSFALSKLKTVGFQGYFSGFVPSYSLNILGNINKTKFAQASLEMQRAVYNSTRLSIISQMSGSYFMLLGQKEQLRDQLLYISDLKKVRQLEYIRYKDGASDLSTITNLDQQISSNEANIKSIENSISQVENAMQVLLNQNPGAIVTDKTINSLSVRGLIPEHLSSAVLKNRPDVIIAEENLKMADANIGIAYSSFFPTINLTGLLGGASVDLINLLKLSTGLGVAQATVSMPLLNGVYYAQIKEAKAGYEASCFSYVQTIRSVFADVNNSLTNQINVNDAYANQLKSYHAAKRAYNLAFARYKAGAKDYRDVANARLNLDSAKLDLTLAKMQQLDGIVAVYQSLAGGYK